VDAERGKTGTLERGRVAGVRIDRRTFLKAVGLGAIGVLAADRILARELATLAATSALPAPDPIAELALELAFDRERIFRFVADEIRYEPYAGVLRGPRGTLVGRAGNSADQATLLAALLEASGLAHRFAIAPIDAATSDALLASAGSTIDAARAELIDVLLGAGAGGRPLRMEPDEAARARLEDAAARADAVTAWTRAQVQDTVSMIEAALSGAGIDVPGAFPGLPPLERDQHVWIQHALGPRWVDLDPSLPSAVEGAAAASPAMTTEALPRELRHRVRLSVVAETVDGPGLREESLLELEEFADVLAGSPITFVNVEHQGLKRLGADIVSNLQGGTAYVPCLIVGEDIVAASGVIRFGGEPDDLFGQPGADATEGDLPDGEPIAEWLEIAIMSPGREPDVVRRPVFDRLGPAARAAGASGRSTLGPAALIELEPGAPPDHAPAQRTISLTVHTGVIGGEELGARLGTTSVTSALPGVVEAYHVVREAAGAEAALPLGVRTFADGPNVASLTIDQELASGGLVIRPVFDIWHRSLGVIPIADASATVTPAILAGVVPHVAERLLAGDADDEHDDRGLVASVGGVFDAARREGIGLRLVMGPDDLPDLALPDDALARLARSVSDGQVAIVPERAVMIGGADRSGWWLVDPVTGRTVDEMDDGRGSAEEGVVLQADAEAVPSLRRLGTCAGVVFLMAAPVIVGIALADSSNPGVSALGVLLALNSLAGAGASIPIPPGVEPPPAGGSGLLGC
jgi:transglutaminase-like putative cysteine protease